MAMTKPATLHQCAPSARHVTSPPSMLLATFRASLPDHAEASNAALAALTLQTMNFDADAPQGGRTPSSECVREPLSVPETIRRHHSALLSFLRMRLRVSHLADDVAQESYIRMMQYEGSREISSPSSMLFRIAINVANDLGRSELARRASHHCGLDDVDLVSEVPSMEREIGARQDLDLLRAAIAQLSPKCRTVFLMSRARLMTYPEIARHCGISVKMVEKHISRALAICTATVREAAEPRSQKRPREFNPRGRSTPSNAERLETIVGRARVEVCPVLSAAEHTRS